MTIPNIEDCVGMFTFQTYLNNKLNGVPLANGYIKFFSDVNRTVLKDVYQISGSPPNYGLLPIPNPNTLNADGTLSDGAGGRVIPYFYPYNSAGNIELYYIEVYDGMVTLVPQETLEGFPPNVVPSSDEDTINDVNYVQNPQFLIWDHVPVTYGSGTPPSGATIVTSVVNAGQFEQLCDGWYFQRSNASGTTDSWSQKAFGAGQTTVEGNPRYYLEYAATVSTNETYKRLCTFFYKNAQLLQGQAVSLSIQLRSDIARNINVKWYQNFGDGTSSLSANLATIATTTTWQKNTVHFTIPSTSTATLGSGYSDYAALIFELDINTNATYDFANVCLRVGNLSDPAFLPMTYSQYLGMMDPFWWIPTGQFSFFGPGTLTSGPGAFTPLNMNNWLEMIDQTIGNPSSGADNATIDCYNLFVYLWATYDNTVCHILTSAGAPTVRGADAIADWNANKRMPLPLVKSRLLGASGHGSGLTSRVPGASGGGEDVLKSHTHGTLTAGLTFCDATAMTDLTNISLGGADIATRITTPRASDATTAAASANYTSDTMNPFTFLQLFIHK